MAVTGGFFDIDNALKQAYPKRALEPLLNQETPFRKKLKASIPSGAKASGGLLKFGTILHNPQNMAQILDGAALVVPNDRTQDVFTLKPTMFTGGFQIGWITKAAANTSNVTFTNGGEAAQRTEETLADMGKFMEQTYIAGDGSGKRGESAGGGSTTTDILAFPWGTRLLRVNQMVSARTTAGGDTIGGTGANGPDYKRITDINHDTRTITYTTSSTGAALAGDCWSVVAKAAQTGLTSINASAEGTIANGIRGLVDDGTYAQYIHGLDRTATGYSKLNSVVRGNGGVLRNLTEQILINAVHTVGEKIGKRPSEIWTNYGQVEKYIEFVAPDRRYAVSGNGTQGFGTGYKNDGDLVHYAPGVALKFNVSYDALPREMFLLNWDSFFLYQAQELDWWPGEMLKPVPASGGGWVAAYQAHLAAVENLGCDMPLANVVIRDLKDPIAGD